MSSRRFGSWMRCSASTMAATTPRADLRAVLERRAARDIPRCRRSRGTARRASPFSMFEHMLGDLEAGDRHGLRRLDRHVAVDQSVLERRQRGGRVADRHDRHVLLRVEPGFAQQELQRHVGRGAGRADADLQAFQVRDHLRIGLAGIRRRHLVADDHAERRTRQREHEQLDVLALAGDRDAMLDRRTRRSRSSR